MGRYHHVFPRWSNLLLPGVLLFGATAPVYVVFVVAYGFSPLTTDVGYQPEQPVPFSHELHAGQLGLDCRYCHNTVERTPKASIPPTQTCMNCHKDIHKDSVKIAPLLESYKTGMPMGWKRVHDLPDFAFFDHSAHVTRGVSCVACHGRIDTMAVVAQHEPLSMGWCLACHRNPDKYIRDPAFVTDLDWTFSSVEGQTEDEYHEFWKNLHRIDPSQDCSTCHR